MSEDLDGNDCVLHEGLVYIRVLRGKIIAGDLLVDNGLRKLDNMFAESSVGREIICVAHFANVYRLEDVVASVPIDAGRCACGGRMVPYDGEMLCMRCP